ncbi:MAG: class I SAM-dependent methyltransferase [bacterium]
MTTEGLAEVSARFNRVAAGWDSNPARVDLAKGVTEAIQKAVPITQDMAILDFGAGTGLLTLGLLPYVAHVTAVDASDEMLRVLADKLKAMGIENVNTRHCDIGKEPLPEAEYSLVVSSMVLHHIVDVPRTLHLLRRCLRPSGWIALADLDSEDGSFHPDPTGVFHKGFDRGQICRWLKEAGFVDVSIQDAYQMKRQSDGGQAREYPLFLATGRVG